MVAFTIVILLFFVGCSDNKIKKVVVNTAVMPQLSSDSITTIVSDSGIIRYKIYAPHWEIFDKIDTPCWNFSEGLRFERFDSLYNVDANIFSKKAVYYTEMELWKLNDSVRAVNIQGENFETNELFWNQKTQTIYSDSAIKVTQADKIIYGVGFESNQEFTRYTIRKPTGIIPVENKD